MSLAGAIQFLFKITPDVQKIEYYILLVSGMVAVYKYEESNGRLQKDLFYLSLLELILILDLQAATRECHQKAQMILCGRRKPHRCPIWALLFAYSGFALFYVIFVLLPGTIFTKAVPICFVFETALCLPPAIYTNEIFGRGSRQPAPKSRRHLFPTKSRDTIISVDLYL